MPKPQQCRLVGGASLILGIGVIVAGSIFLHGSTYHNCFGYSNYNQFEHVYENGGTHGGYRPGGPLFESLKTQKKSDEYGIGYPDQNQNSYPRSPSSVLRPGGSSYSSSSSHSDGYEYGNEYENKKDDGNFYDKIKKCPYIIKKFKTCSIVGIVAGIIQILLSTLYCFAMKKTVKILSTIWCITHFIILIALVAIAGVVLSIQKGGDYKKRYQDEDDYELYAKKLTFAIISLIDAFLIIIILIFVCLTWKKSDYDDYSVGKNDQELIAKRKIQES